MAAKTAIIVLAAGEGTRMRSHVPKVLHRIAGRPLIAYVLEAAKGAGADKIAVVVGPGQEKVAAEAKLAMWPPSSEETLLARTTMAIAFQRT